MLELLAHALRSERAAAGRSFGRLSTRITPFSTSGQVAMRMPGYFDEGVGAGGSDVSIVKQRYPDIHVKQAATAAADNGRPVRVPLSTALVAALSSGWPRQIPSRSINSRTCSTVMTSSRAGNNAKRPRNGAVPGADARGLSARPYEDGNGVTQRQILAIRQMAGDVECVFGS